MAHRLLIIQPSHYRSRTDRRVFKTRRRSVVPLVLPYLAALTPSDWDVTLLDEQVQDVDFGAHVDLVAITTWTIHSLRAYDIARQFRARRVPVIMGGPHVYFFPEEAAEHCDAIGVGEGELLWAKMLNDAASGRLQKLYRAKQMPNLAGLPLPRYNLLDLWRYGPIKTFAVASSRGCPFRCDFCSERLYLGGGYRCRPVAEVVEEVKWCRSRYIFFAESNFGGKRDHAMELMAALVPLKVRWSTLWSSYLCHDGEFMDLARRSGLLHVNIGVESIHPETLNAMNKQFNAVDQYAEMLAGLRDRGISYSLNFIFGWDNEPPDVYRATLEFLQRHKVPAAFFNVLSPQKGTPLFERLQRDGRILNADEVERWPGQICYIRPQHGTPEQLERNVLEMYRQFYSLPSILARLPWSVTKANIASWAVNLSQRRMLGTIAGDNNFDSF